jgi:hypothetical protein
VALHGEPLVLTDSVPPLLSWGAAGLEATLAARIEVRSLSLSKLSESGRTASVSQLSESGLTASVSQLRSTKLSESGRTASVSQLSESGLTASVSQLF